MNDAEKKKERYSGLRWDIHRLKELIACYRGLFWGSEEDFNALVKFESEFFATIQIVITDSIVGKISKLFDKRTDVLSIHQFLNAYANKVDQARLFQWFDEIRAQAEPIIRVRHDWIAHKNHDVALGLKKLPEVKISDLESVIHAIGECFEEIRVATYPNGVFDSDGTEVVFVRSERAEVYTKKFIENIKRSQH